MALRVITGTMGAGKSFEAVAEHILPSVQKGQRVVTSVDGINHEAFANYLNKPLEEIQKLIILVKNHQLKEPDFWYHPQKNPDALIQPGDHFVGDEMWEMWGKKGQKGKEEDWTFTPQAEEFVAMHRHYVHPDGHTCDITLMNQAFGSLHEFLRDRTELRYNCKKLKNAGLEKMYTVALYEPGERKPSRSFVRSYKKDIFPLYKSYDAASGATESKDKRQNIFNGVFFKIVMPLSLLGIIGGAWYTFHFIHNIGNAHFIKGQPVKGEGPASGVSAASSSGAASGVTAPQASAVAASAGVSSPQHSAGGEGAKWRVAASWVQGGMRVFKLVDKDGQYRTLTAPSWSAGVGEDVSVHIPRVDDDVATPFTGPPPRVVNSTPSNSSSSQPSTDKTQSIDTKSTSTKKG